jgi:hypothetical protein
MKAQMAMSAEDRERWHELSLRAMSEQDPKKVKAVLDEINRLLESKVVPRHK